MYDDDAGRTYTQGIRFGQERMKAVLQAGRMLHTTHDLDNLLSMILYHSVNELNSETGTVFLVDDNRKNLVSRIVEGDQIKEIVVPVNHGLVGATFLLKKILNISNPYDDKRFDKSIDKKTGYKTRNILSIPLINRSEESIGVIQVLNKNIGDFTEDDEELAAVFATFAAIAVENAKMMKFLIERERLDKEFNLARKIQSTFLQGEIPELKGFDIATLSEPCYQIGGDYMKLTKINDNEYLSMVADVSGKGIPAALITLALHAYVSVLFPDEKDFNELPVTLANKDDYPILLNKLIKNVAEGRAYVTMCAARINSLDSKVSICNCGHNKPILIHSDGSYETIDSTTAVLGILPEIEVNAATFQMKSNDILCLYTDGIIEASSEIAKEDEERDEFGIDRLIKLLLEKRDSSSLNVLSTIKKAVDEFTQNRQKEDDITLVIIKKL